MQSISRTMRKPAALLLVLVIILSFSITASASSASYPIQASVKFYNGASQLGTTQTVTYTGDISKSYLPIGYPDPLDSAPSVYDAITASAGQFAYSTAVGWDANPSYGDPGGYISAVDGYAPVNTYTYENGIHTSYGYGWNAYIDGEPAYSYTTLIALENGSQIEFKYEYYYYQW